jgi:hypothetical protein
MSEVQLLDIGETEREAFTRWDITGHQVNRHLRSKVLHFFAGVGSVDDIGYEAYPGHGEATASLGRKQGGRSCA